MTFDRFVVGVLTVLKISYQNYIVTISQIKRPNIIHVFCLPHYVIKCFKLLLEAAHLICHDIWNFIMKLLQVVKNETMVMRFVRPIPLTKKLFTWVR